METEIKVNELRIGNIFKALGKDRVLQGVTKRNKDGAETAVHYAEFKGVIPIKLFHLKPIPLTEEWLVKFGFEKTMNGFYLSVGNQFVEYRDGEVYIGGEDSCINGMCFSLTVKYVHSLQNLIFALTGKELTLISKCQH